MNIDIDENERERRQVWVDLEAEMTRQKKEDDLLSKNTQTLTDDDKSFLASILSEKSSCLRGKIAIVNRELIIHKRKPTADQNFFDLCIKEGKHSQLKKELDELLKIYSEIEFGDMRLPSERFHDSLSITISNLNFTGDFQKSKKLEKVSDWARANGVYLIDNT